MELTARLKSVYNLLPQDCIMIDVGTDHCHLPIYALRQGKIQKAYASDVRIGPLQNGQKNAEIYHCSEHITTLLSDGLEALTPAQVQEIDTYVCAGMGGMLIRDIIDRAPFLRSSEKTLILQPQTAIFELKSYLAESGFNIVSESLSREGEKLYICMKAHYDGKKRKAGNPYLGILHDPLFEVYMNAQKRRYTKQKKGLEAGGIQDKTRYQEVCKILDYITKAQGEKQK